MGKDGYVAKYQASLYAAASGDFEGLDSALEAMVDAALEEEVEPTIFGDDLADIDNAVEGRSKIDGDVY